MGYIKMLVGLRKMGLHKMFETFWVFKLASGFPLQLKLLKQGEDNLKTKNHQNFAPPHNLNGFS